MNQDKCPNCGRVRTSIPSTEKWPRSHEYPAYGVVLHSYYGCDTGCCGLSYELVSEDGRVICSEFRFEHPYGDEEIEEFKPAIEEWGKVNGVPIHWDECELACTQ